MKAITDSRMRELEEKTIESGVPEELLMERAGAAVADLVGRYIRISQWERPRILVFAGCGNNGGDAFVAARILSQRGAGVELLIAGETGRIRGEARGKFESAMHAGLAPYEPGEGPNQDCLAFPRRPFRAVIIDGIFGTGFRGRARGAPAAAIKVLNELGARNMVVSIDIPSGIDADTGEACGEAVKADITLTMGLPKRGLVLPSSIEYTGRVEVADIGIPGGLVAAVDSDLDLITAEDLRPMFRPRGRNTHKGTFGHVLIAGGAAGYAGAVAMAARAALRSGAGLVSALVPEGIVQTVAGMVPEAMVHAGVQTAEGSLSAGCIAKWKRSLDEFDAILLGPGLTMHDDSETLVRRMLERKQKCLVLDADAINVLRGMADSLKVSFPVILTPHPGEMARFAGMTADAVQSARMETATGISGKTGAVVVLKGAGTVAAMGNRCSVNRTGNPGMACAGMGDVLGGLISGLAAQGFEAFDAARAGIYIHGVAGDQCSECGTQNGITAGDVIEQIPVAIRAVAAR